MPSKAPPSFGSQDYWNERFTSNTDPFEWLEAPNALDPYISQALDAADEEKPELLHIGCGTSLLSYHLRSHVDDPKQIHNLDYSDVAINLGKKREHELYQYENPHNENTEDAAEACMRWDAVDLLQYQSILRACKRTAYSVIVDKSTCDSISCADDVDVPLPYPVAVRSYEPLNMDMRKSSEPLHPLIVTAVNLALVTRPGARWIALSYSNDRFYFLNPTSGAASENLAFPDSSKLWKVVEKREVEDAGWQVRNENGADVTTHRPKVCNWVYVLERTKVPLFVRGEHI
jgi:hypothetical protein